MLSLYVCLYASNTSSLPVSIKMLAPCLMKYAKCKVVPKPSLSSNWHFMK